VFEAKHKSGAAAVSARSKHRRKCHRLAVQMTHAAHAQLQGHGAAWQGGSSAPPASGVPACAALHVARGCSSGAAATCGVDTAVPHWMPWVQQLTAAAAGISIASGSSALSAPCHMSCPSLPAAAGAVPAQHALAYAMLQQRSQTHHQQQQQQAAQHAMSHLAAGVRSASMPQLSAVAAQGTLGDVAGGHVMLAAGFGVGAAVARGCAGAAAGGTAAAARTGTRLALARRSQAIAALGEQRQQHAAHPGTMGPAVVASLLYPASTAAHVGASVTQAAGPAAVCGELMPAAAMHAAACSNMAASAHQWQQQQKQWQQQAMLAAVGGLRHGDTQSSRNDTSACCVVDQCWAPHLPHVQHFQCRGRRVVERLASQVQQQPEQVGSAALAAANMCVCVCVALAAATCVCERERESVCGWVWVMTVRACHGKPGMLHARSLFCSSDECVCVGLSCANAKNHATALQGTQQVLMRT
jgi:hypothetical protein